MFQRFWSMAFNHLSANFIIFLAITEPRGLRQAITLKMTRFNAKKKRENNKKNAMRFPVPTNNNKNSLEEINYFHFNSKRIH